VFAPIIKNFKKLWQVSLCIMHTCIVEYVHSQECGNLQSSSTTGMATSRCR
jgi:hypothetical protein